MHLWDGFGRGGEKVVRQGTGRQGQRRQLSSQRTTKLPSHLPRRCRRHGGFRNDRRRSHRALVAHHTTPPLPAQHAALGPVTEPRGQLPPAPSPPRHVAEASPPAAATVVPAAAPTQPPAPTGSTERPPPAQHAAFGPTTEPRGQPPPAPSPFPPPLPWPAASTVAPLPPTTVPWRIQRPRRRLASTTQATGDPRAHRCHRWPRPPTTSRPRLHLLRPPQPSPHQDR